MKKRSLLALIALIVACMLVFAACGGGADKEDEKKDDETTVSTEDTTAAPEVDDTTAVPEVDTPTEKTDEEKVADYVALKETSIISVFESALSGSGLTCNSTVKAEGTGIVVTICINELVDIPEEQKAVLQSTFDQNAAALSGNFAPIQAEIPELTYVKFNYCEKDGDLIATFTIDGSTADAPATDVPSTAVGSKSYQLGSPEEGEMIILALVYDANGYVTNVVYAMVAEIGVSTSDAETLEYTFTTIKGKFDQLKSDGGNVTVEYEVEEEGYFLKAEYSVSNEVEAAFAADMFGVANNGALVKFADVDASLLADGFTEYTE